ncbi:hypothetical protein UB48_02980 [Pseudomonas sp. 2(2015)]|nr:hypothetical protein UB48_02980 [Pseudomonas sp. 2(2015)]
MDFPGIFDKCTGTFVSGAEEQHAAPVVIVVRVVDVVLDKLMQGLLQLGNSGFQLVHDAEVWSQSVRNKVLFGFGLLMHAAVRGAGNQAGATGGFHAVERNGDAIDAVGAAAFYDGEDAFAERAGD